MQTQSTINGRAWRLVRRSAAGLVLLILLLASTGAIYNSLTLHRLRKANPPPGKIYTVDGHEMHLYCTGTGTPTLVLESGRGDSFLVWGKVQPSLSRTTRVCSYDRAGLGWSAPAEGPRDSEHIAEQLHALLAEAGIQGPLVLMGHSAGGTHIRVYAARYPEQVGGLVFLDSATAAQLPARIAALDHHSATSMALFKAAIALGIPRAMGACSTPPPGFAATAKLWRADACKPSYVTAYAREQEAGPQSMAQAGRVGGFGDMPILVFSRDSRAPRPRGLPTSISTAEWERADLIHDTWQEKLAHRSTRGRRIIARNSGHYIQFDRPDLVVREVNDFVRGIREKRDQPSSATITE